MRLRIRRIFEDRQINEVKELWNGFWYRLIIRVLWPIIPICLEILIRVLIGKEVMFPNRTVLVLAFIIPSSYLPDFKSEISINLITMLCLLATVPFFCSIVTSHNVVYWTGFFLFVFFLALFVAMDFVATMKKHSNILERGD